MDHFKQFTFKRFGYLDFNNHFSEQLPHLDLNSFIKIIFIRAGGKVMIDFKEYDLGQDALFFVNAGQYYLIDDQCCGMMLYYNRDFYCIEIHDHEVACDGILFHNVYEIPVVWLEGNRSAKMQEIFAEIKSEIETNESSLEEMLRTLLKQIIIKSTRSWKQVHHLNTNSEEASSEIEFSRSFSQLVEWHYTRHHTVAAYADLLHISPKALNKRITRYSNTTPNEVIKNRIILEAKRLLVYTPLSVKEIGYKLGYDDPSYFVRLFSKQAATSPQNFRLQYQQTR
jgi:AraC-like DNA-binding protein